MAININIISQSTKNVDIHDLSNNLVNSTFTNEIVNLDLDTSYVCYISPYQEVIEFTSGLNIITDLFTGFIGYIWIVFITVLVIILLRSVKEHVK